MMSRVIGEFTEFGPDTFYGGRHDFGVLEYLFRLPDGRWFLYGVNLATLAGPVFSEIPEDQAVDWLTRSRRAEEDSSTSASTPERIAPHWAVIDREWSRYGSATYHCPPPVGPHVVIRLPKASRTWDAIDQRQTQFLYPGKVLERLLWPASADVALTVGFGDERHDPLVLRLHDMLEARLLERPRLSILQSLQDRGCDLLIEWPLRAKYGVQLKSNGDVEDDGFAAKTLAQIQDSRQHGLERLFVILAADITNTSNAQKVRGFVSRISSMNDPYVVAVPPERAWTLLLPNRSE